MDPRAGDAGASRDPGARRRDDEAVFARFLDRALRSDGARTRERGATRDFTATIMRTLGYRPSRSAASAQRAGSSVDRSVACSPSAAIRRAAAVRPSGAMRERVVRTTTRVATCLVLGSAIGIGLVAHNSMPQAVQPAATTLPNAVKDGLEREGRRLDGFLRELRRSGPSAFVPSVLVPVRQESVVSPSSKPSIPSAPGRGDRDNTPPRDADPAGPEPSSGAATAPFRWV
jgi:hypothetical protein